MFDNITVERPTSDLIETRNGSVNQFIQIIEQYCRALPEKKRSILCSFLIHFD